MPHKRAKHSLRERARAERKLDLPPSEATFSRHDIPKSMARVLNAEAVQSAYRERKRAVEVENGGEASRQKRRRLENGSAKPGIKIKPGESLKHFKRRVEDDMRPLIRSAMKNTTSVSKQKLKESQKAAEQLANSRSKHSDLDSDSEGTPGHPKGGKKQRSPSPDFMRVSSSAPKRLNDVAKAPPNLKVPPRLGRLAREAQKQRSESKSEDADDGIVTLQQKRMMELEREKAINRYRALKEAKLKERQKDGEALT